MGLLNWIEGGLRGAGASATKDPGALWLRWAQRAHYRDQGLDYLTQATNLGNAEAQLELGLFYAEGGDGPGAQAYALELFKKSAVQGNLEAGYHLAESLRGAGRHDEALAWYRRTAEAGYGPSMFWLATALQYADGVEQQDLEKSAHWRSRMEALEEFGRPRRSAIQALPETPDLDFLVRLTRAIRDGLEPWAGPWVHRLWFVLALWTGVGLALGALTLAVGMSQFQTGFEWNLILVPLLVGFFTGVRMWWGLSRGTRYSRFRGRLWIPVFKGDAESSFRYGLDLKVGTREVPKDLEAARHWLEKAARQGHLEAMVHLAELLRWGSGGPKLPEEAWALLDKAAKAGHPGAAEQLQAFKVSWKD